MHSGEQTVGQNPDLQVDGTIDTSTLGDNPFASAVTLPDGTQIKRRSQHTTSYPMLAVQIGAGCTGLLIVKIFNAPSKNCAANPVCGQWLSDFLHSAKVSENIFFYTAATDLGAMNFYFSFEAIPTYVQYMRELTTWPQRVGATVFIAGFGATQVLDRIYLSRGLNSSKDDEKKMIIGASVGIVFTMTRNVPWVFSKVSELSYTYIGLKSCFSDLAPEEKHQLDRFNHYAREYGLFKARLHSSFENRVYKDAKEFVAVNDFQSIEDLLEILMTPETTNDNLAHWEQHSLHLLAKIIAMGPIAGFVCFMHVVTIYNEMTENPAETPLNVKNFLVTLVLSLSYIYNLNTTSIQGVSGLFQTLDNLRKGKKVPSVLAQLHPVLATMTYTPGFLSSLLSHCAMFSLTDKQFDTLHWRAKKEADIYSMVVINLWHAIVVIHGIRIVVPHLIPQKHRLLMNMEQMISHELTGKTVTQFIDFAKNSTKAGRNYEIAFFPGDEPDPENPPVLKFIGKKESICERWFGYKRSEDVQSSPQKAKAPSSWWKLGWIFGSNDPQGNTEEQSSLLKTERRYKSEPRA